MTIARKKIEVVTFEPLGKRRKEYGEAIGRMATERAGASESTVTLARTIAVVTNYEFSRTFGKIPDACHVYRGRAC